MTEAAAERIARAQPFAGRLRLVRVERALADSAHSGTAFFVSADDGRRFKLRDCGSARRAARVARWVAALPDVFPALVDRAGCYLLLEALEAHRPVTRAELLRRARDLGRIGARVYDAGRADGSRGRLARLAGAAGAQRRFRADLRVLRRSGLVPAESCAGAAAKWRAYRARFGLSVELELDDLHKGNWMLRDADGDLRYVDEEGIGLRPLGTGLASLLKTATRSRTWRLYREGWAERADAGFLTPEYTEYVLLMDAVRRVAHKLRSEARIEKLPREIAELREMADTPGLALAWRFPKG